MARLLLRRPQSLRSGRVMVVAVAVLAEVDLVVVLAEVDLAEVVVKIAAHRDQGRGCRHSLFPSQS